MSQVFSVYKFAVFKPTSVEAPVYQSNTEELRNQMPMCVYPFWCCPTNPLVLPAIDHNPLTE